MIKANVEKKGKFSGHLDCVYALAGGVGGTFFSTGADGVVAVWEAARPNEGRALFRSEIPLYALAVSDEVVAAGRRDGGLIFFDKSEGEALRTVAAHKDAIFSLVFLPKIACWVVASRTGEISLWDNDYKRIANIKVSNAGLRAIAVHPTGDYFATAGGDGFVRVYEARSLTKMLEFPAHTGTIFTMVYAPNGFRLLTAGKDARLKVWQDEVLYTEIIAHHFAIHALVFRPDAKFFASGSMDKTIKLWDAENFRLIKVVDKRRNDAHASSVNALFWNDSNLISASDDRQIFSWDIEFY